ncbi:MAG: hypothetical protein IKB47_00715 [Clostridia bacterium]|nr:hypothetical protein [Clostridia bacterium]
MKIQTFKNGKGIIHGNDPKRIGCDIKSGLLKIGNTEIKIPYGEDAIMPSLFHGATGDYNATFTDEQGTVYTLEKVAVRGGRILPPSPTAVEIMELHCRADEAEAERDALKEKVWELEHIFDTNSLNFLIK